MQDEIVIEQMKLSERDDLLGFLRPAYADNPRHGDRKFWDWHFLESPNSDAENLTVWLAKSGHRIVGQLAATPVELDVAGEVHQAIWILDLIVEPKFRRMGIAKKLALASKEFCPFVLGVNTSAQHSTELLEGLGWKVVTKIPRYQRILFPGNALREVAKVRHLRSAVNLAFAPFRPKVTKLACYKDNVAAVTEFDSVFDDLWRDARRQWPCSISRSSAMLNWQFRRQPGKKFDILGYFENGKLLGYEVLFFRKPDAHGSISKAAISDICYHPDNPTAVVDKLLHAALQLAIERQAGSFVTDTLDPLLVERLRHFGFRRVQSNLQLVANVPRDKDVIYDPANWFLTRGDADISIFEDPNL